MPADRRVAFLRGINVGGARVLKMDVLRKVAAKAGLHDPATIGASGNLLYSSTRPLAADADALVAGLDRHVEGVVVVVRDAGHMRKLAKVDRFAKADKAIPDKWRFVAFLAAPSKAKLPVPPEGSGLTILGRTADEVFYAMSDPTPAASAMVGRLDRALGTPVTVRNWNVVRDVAERLMEADA
jgi:uncharacterized protein (DUF1697 family)